MTVASGASLTCLEQMSKAWLATGSFSHAPRAASLDLLPL